MTTIRRVAIAGAIAAFIAATAPATNAYTTYGKWGTLLVSFYVNAANADVSENAAISALQAGMETWNKQSGTAFRFNYAGQVGVTTTGYDGKNVMLFRNVSNGSTIASTYSWALNGLLVDSDVVFWDGGFKFFTGASGCSGGAYIEDISAHELGHAMGLQHSGITEATMYGSYSGCSQALRTLSSDDVAGAQKLYANGAGVADTPPTVKILSPANGATVTATTSAAFSGSATDTTDGDISARLIWHSNVSGQIGTGASFSKALPAGSHTITATVKDSIGYTTQVGIVLTVTAASTNTAPSVTIASPSNGATVTAGTSVSFSGTASDTQEGPLTSRLVWRSSVDGQLGTGGTVSRALTAGTHTVTATVTDSGGLTTQRGITIYAASAPALQTSAMATLSVRGYKDKGLQKVDLVWNGLSATQVDVYRNSGKITTRANDGTMTDAIDAKGAGTYTYKVCAAGTATCSNLATATF
jgi:hypothetical protein